MIGIAEFFQKYRISAEAFREAGLSWQTLVNITDDYARITPALENVGRYIVEAILKCPRVHSIKYRLKDPEHLIEKIIRKTIHDPSRNITAENYRQSITDLVGIRALHLFKEDWVFVHEYIRDTWQLAEKPTAYVRAGDSEKIVQYYRDNECEVREHRFGYRSVHYLVETKPDREQHVVEIQARTVFEEGWGEIDHVISYPYHTENELLVRLSSVLNRLAANADELGSYMRYLKSRTDAMETQFTETISEKNSLIEKLKHRIDRLEIAGEEKDALRSDLTRLGSTGSEHPELTADYPWLEHLIESNLFKGIADRINTIVNSDQFQQIELTDDDLEMLSHAQKDLMRLMNDPKGVELMMREQPLRKLIAKAQDAQAEQDARNTKNDGAPR
ncbi:MAG: hypothetical protein EA426_13820 [Spirochaetaceae bacterium]|nr:MAG: hypothetical protein EA426_13820 [Spirochaetaceae bacterium]